MVRRWATDSRIQRWCKWCKMRYQHLGPGRSIKPRNIWAGIDAVNFIDDWMPHAASGDLHCMAITFRDASKVW